MGFISHYVFIHRNPNVITIESKLMEALVKINAVKEEHVISYLGDNLNQVC